MVFLWIWLALQPLPAQLSSGRRAVGETRAAPPVSGPWLQAGTGRWVWQARVQSTGAGAVRIHFRDFHIGAGSLTISAGTSDSRSTFTGDGLFGDGDFWGPILAGDSLLIEYRPEDGQPAAPTFAIDTLAHFYPPAKRGSAERDLELGCDVDPYGTVWQPAMGPVALMVFQDAALSQAAGTAEWFTCTGTLIADSNNSKRALFLTAHHCIQREDDARSLTTYWNFQTTPTASYPKTAQNVANFWNIPSLATSLPSVNGAHLLYTVSESEGDASLLELSALPPNPQFAPFNTQEVALNASTGTIHQPDGSWKRLASGLRAPITSGREAGANIFGKYRPSDYYYKFLETTGLSDYGSSGGAVLTATDFLVSGVLSAGPAPSCFSNSRYAVYGRLNTFLPRIQNYFNNITPNSCTLDTNATNVTVPSTQVSGSFQMITPAGCAWAVAADNDWITVSQRAGFGSATINYQLTANSNPNITTTSRAGSISVIGEQRRVVHFQQRGADTAPVYLDTDIGDPFTEFISYIQRNKIFSAYGCSPGNFCPGAATTRGMMAQFIIQSLYPNDSFNIQTEDPYFADVPKTHPGFRYVQKMKELTITSGCSQTTYCPDDPVTRGQMAVFIIRAMQFKNGLAVRSDFPYSPVAYFSDMPASDSFFPFVQKMKEVGITSGCSGSAYCGGDPNTRGQIAVFLTRGLFALWEGRLQ